MFSDDLLLRFRATRFGWINPKGELIVCQTYQHLEVLDKKARYDELYQQAEENMNETLEYEAEVDPNSWPALHRFDSSGDARRGVMLEAYHEGWVRLGAWGDEYKKIEAISTVPTITLHIERLKFITDVLGYELIARDQFDQKLGPKDRQRLGLGRDRP